MQLNFSQLIFKNKRSPGSISMTHGAARHNFGFIEMHESDLACGLGQACTMQGLKRCARLHALCYWQQGDLCG